MTLTSDDFNLKTLQKYEKKKLLKKSSHPVYELFIWNYTETVQFKKLWDSTLLMCRGLITDASGNIISRSFNKFFNLEEKQHIATPNFRTFDKLDGSLGILFWYPFANEWIFTSRGSFVSDQAFTAMDILKKNHPDFDIVLDKNKSYIFEIIYNENRIVVNYNNKRSVIFLSAFDTIGNEYLDFDFMKKNGFEIVEEYNASDLELLKERNLPNKEGYVILFDNGQRVKIKFNDYLSLHRICTNFSIKTIFDDLKKGIEMMEIVEKIPDEYHDWFKSVYGKIQDQFVCIEKEAKFDFEKYKSQTTTIAEFGKLVQETKNSAILFKMYNNEDYTKYIWNLINIKDIKSHTTCKIPFTSRKHTPFKNEALLIFLIGISGSGKSTWVKNYIKTRRNIVQIVNRDNIRNLLFSLDNNRDIIGYYNSKELGICEKMVTKFETQMIHQAISENKIVVIDNTNLKREYIMEKLKNLPKNCKVVYKKIELDVEDCVKRIENRERKVSKKIILEQFKQLQSLDISKLPTSFVYPKLVNDCSKRDCIIFDIDGTLALNNSGRNMYDMSRVDQDDVNTHVLEILNYLNNDFDLIICTGRDDTSEAKTKKWLNDNQIFFDCLYMRKNGDMRKDYIVKEEMWRKICETYYIKYMFDDRNQVVNHARKLGLKVFQVAEGNF